MAKKRFALHHTIYLDADSPEQVECFAEFIVNTVVVQTENMELYKAIQDAEEYYIEELEEDE